VFAAQAAELRAQRGGLLQACRPCRACKPLAERRQHDPGAGAGRRQPLRPEGARVLVKNVSKMHPLLANCLRLTVGTADENAQMLAALKDSL
jgi:histidinol-phosphate aminotransferase